MAADGKVRDEGDEGSPEAEAAEYVLGTLDPRERRAAEWRLRRDLAFASAVARWSEQLAVLDSGLSPVAPPERVWRGIEAGLKGVVQPAADTAQLRRSITRWRFATAAPRWRPCWWPPSPCRDFFHRRRVRRAMSPFSAGRAVRRPSSPR